MLQCCSVADVAVLIADVAVLQMLQYCRCCSVALLHCCTVADVALLQMLCCCRCCSVAVLQMLQCCTVAVL